MIDPANQKRADPALKQGSSTGAVVIVPLIIHLKHLTIRVLFDSHLPVLAISKSPFEDGVASTEPSRSSESREDLDNLIASCCANGHRISAEKAKFRPSPTRMTECTEEFPAS